MRPKIREILDDCIADGLRSGYQRAYKYHDFPDEEDLIGNMEEHIWFEIDRRFNFEEYEVGRLRSKKKQIHEDLEDSVDREWIGLNRKREADLKIGAWLSAALEDPITCQSMKDDINEWFNCTPQMESNTDVAPADESNRPVAIVREWVGLSDDEVEDIFTFPWHYIPFARAVEAKLKEKNT